MTSEITIKESSTSIADVVMSDNFSQLNPNIQNQIISTSMEEQTKRGGFIGRLIGTNKDNAAINFGVIISCILFLIIIIDMIHSYCCGQEVSLALFKTIISTETMIIGYIFGSGSN